MGCLSKHRQKQKHGCSSLAWSLGEVAFIQDCTGITAGPLFIIFPPGWSTGLEKAVPAWDIAMGMTPGASVVTVPAQELPRETLHPADLTGSAQQQQHRLLFRRVPFSQVSFCFVSVSPSSVWWGSALAEIN